MEFNVSGTTNLSQLLCLNEKRPLQLCMLTTKQKESHLFDFFLLSRTVVSGLSLSQPVNLVILIGLQCHFLRKAFSDPLVERITLFFLFVVVFFRAHLSLVKFFLFSCILWLSHSPCGMETMSCGSICCCICSTFISSWHLNQEVSHE